MYKLTNSFNLEELAYLALPLNLIVKLNLPMEKEELGKLFLINETDPTDFFCTQVYFYFVATKKVVIWLKEDKHLDNLNSFLSRKYEDYEETKSLNTYKRLASSLTKEELDAIVKHHKQLYTRN